MKPPEAGQLCFCHLVMRSTDLPKHNQQPGFMVQGLFGDHGKKKESTVKGLWFGGVGFWVWGPGSRILGSAQAPRHTNDNIQLTFALSLFMKNLLGQALTHVFDQLIYFAPTIIGPSSCIACQMHSFALVLQVIFLTNIVCHDFFNVN